MQMDGCRLEFFLHQALIGAADLDTRHDGQEGRDQYHRAQCDQDDLDEQFAVAFLRCCHNLMSSSYF